MFIEAVLLVVILVVITLILEELQAQRRPVDADKESDREW